MHLMNTQVHFTYNTLISIEHKHTLLIPVQKNKSLYAAENGYSRVSLGTVSATHGFHKHRFGIGS